jgi:hypothetical protein
MPQGWPLKFAKQAVLRKQITRLQSSQLTLQQVTTHALGKLFLQFSEMAWQRVDAQCVFEVPRLSLGKVLNQVLQVNQALAWNFFLAYTSAWCAWKPPMPAPR